MKKSTKKQKEVMKEQKNTKGSTLSKTELVEIQTEAVYMALKKLENERKEENNKNVPKEGIKWSKMLLQILCIIFLPWTSFTRRRKGAIKIYDAAIIGVSYLIHFVVGGFSYLCGLMLIISIFYCNLFADGWMIVIIAFLLAISLFGFGGLIIWISSELIDETDISKIYTYANTVITILAFIVASISLLISVKNILQF